MLATVDSSAKLIARPRASNDFYKEPRWAVDALLQAERFVGTVWDPACGTGTIPEACRARGLHTVASDIAFRGYDGFAGIHDFLGSERLVDPGTVQNIICNPPFERAEEFIEKGLLTATHKVAMLLRWSFCEGGTGKSAKSRRRRWALEDAPLARIYCFASRVSMPPGDYEGVAKGGAVAFGWLVWSLDHHGPATFHRLHKPAAGSPEGPRAYDEAIREKRRRLVAAGELPPIPGYDP